MQPTNVAEAKAQLSRLIERAVAGEEVIISQRAGMIARCIPQEKEFK